MVGLSTQDLEPNLLDELALIADPHTVLRKPFADAFREACYLEHLADDHGRIDPNKVRARLLDHESYYPRQLSALWSSTYLAKIPDPSDPTGRRVLTVPISGDGSSGNTNKDVPLRRWIGECNAHDHQHDS